MTDDEDDNAIAKAIRYAAWTLGTGDAATAMGAIEAHAATQRDALGGIRDALSSIADALNEVASAIRGDDPIDDYSENFPRTTGDSKRED
jgi:hypothetical protein